MATAGAYASFLGEIHDWWLAHGTPKDVYSKASPIYMMAAKGQMITWQGGDGTPQAKYGIRVGLPGAGSADLATVWGAPTTADRVRAIVNNYGRFYQVPKVSWEQKFLVGDNRIQELETSDHPRRWQNVVSAMFWQNGGGAMSKMSGSGSAVTGTTITLLNKRETRFFEVGDTIDFSSADGTSGSLDGVTRTISGKNHSAGTLTVSATLTGAGVNDNEYVFLNKTHTNDGYRVFNGLDVWNPLSSTTAATTLYSITRANNVTKLAGWREVIQTGADPWNTILSMLKTAYEEDIDIDVIVTTPLAYQELIESARPRSLTMEPGGAGGRMGISNEKMVMGSPVRDNPRLLRYGASGFMVQYPNMKPAYVYPDPYMTNHEVAADVDIAYRAFRMEDIIMAFGQKMPTWISSDSNPGAWYWSQGNEYVQAVYGAMGQLMALNPGNMMVFSPSVT